MAIRHIITIRVAPGRVPEFVVAFQALQTVARHEDGCEQYELFQSLDDPETLVILERWTNQDLLDKHQAAERDDNAGLVDNLVSLWAPGAIPTVERFEQ